MRVYIVSDGDYSDTHNVAVFDNRESAELFAKLNNIYNLVEEFELNPDFSIQKNLNEKGYKDYTVTFDSDGDVRIHEKYLNEMIDVNSDVNSDVRYKYNIYGEVFEVKLIDNNKNHALKIASEKRSMFLDEERKKSIAEKKIRDEKYKKYMENREKISEETDKNIEYMISEKTSSSVSSVLYEDKG